MAFRRNAACYSQSVTVRLARAIACLAVLVVGFSAQCFARCSAVASIPYPLPATACHHESDIPETPSSQESEECLHHAAEQPAFRADIVLYFAVVPTLVPPAINVPSTSGLLTDRIPDSQSRIAQSSILRI